jgi:hypothetical protein
MVDGTKTVAAKLHRRTFRSLTIARHRFCDLLGQYGANGFLQDAPAFWARVDCKPAWHPAQVRDHVPA